MSFYKNTKVQPIFPRCYKNYTALLPDFYLMMVGVPCKVFEKAVSALLLANNAKEGTKKLKLHISTIPSLDLDVFDWTKLKCEEDYRVDYMLIFIDPTNPKCLDGVDKAMVHMNKGFFANKRVDFYYVKKSSDAFLVSSSDQKAFRNKHKRLIKYLRFDDEKCVGEEAAQCFEKILKLKGYSKD